MALSTAPQLIACRPPSCQGSLRSSRRLPGRITFPRLLRPTYVLTCPHRQRWQPTAVEGLQNNHPLPADGQGLIATNRGRARGRRGVGPAIHPRPAVVMVVLLGQKAACFRANATLPRRRIGTDRHRISEDTIVDGIPFSLATTVSPCRARTAATRLTCRLPSAPKFA